MNKKKPAIFSRRMLQHISLAALLEFGPVMVFLVAVEYLNVYGSTVLLMIATIISTFVTYRLQKRIPYLALYVAMMTTIFGYMTLHFHEVKFIQMRDTLYDVTCALTLTIGMIFNISFLRLAFGDVVEMSSRAWNKLTYLWVTYFIVIATSNEIMRRLFSLDEWFSFKGIVVVITVLFGITALYLSYEENQ